MSEYTSVERRFFGLDKGVTVLPHQECTNVNIRLDGSDDEYWANQKLEDGLFWAGFFCHSTQDLIDEIEHCEPVTDDMILEEKDVSG